MFSDITNKMIKKILREYYADMSFASLDGFRERLPIQVDNNLVPLALWTIVGEMLLDLYLYTGLVGAAGDKRFGKSTLGVSLSCAIIFVECIAGLALRGQVAMDGQRIDRLLIRVLHNRSQWQDAVRARKEWPALQRRVDGIRLATRVGLSTPEIEPGSTCGQVDLALARAFFVDRSGEKVFADQELILVLVDLGILGIVVV